MSAESLTPVAEIALQGAILLFCAFVQSAVGFAFSLFSTSLLLLAGLALPETVMLSTLASTLQRLLMTSRLWRHVDWRVTLPLSGVCLLTLPVGILLLRFCARQNIGQVKMGMGVLVLAVLAVQTVWRVRPRQALHRGWGALAAAASGVLTGLANIGGPPLLLWVHAHNWPNEKTRVTPMAITTILVPVQVTLILTTFGWQVFPSAAQAAALVPAVVIGTWIGMAAGGRLSKPRLRVIAFSLLALISLVSILGR